MSLSRADRVTVIVGVVLVGLLYLSRIQSYLLFHTLAEILFVVVCLSVTVMAWSLHRLLDDDLAVFLGAALCAVAILHVAHLVDYPGLGMISGSLDPPTQLWLAARVLFATSFIASAFVIGRRISMTVTGAIFAAYALVALASIYWWQVFPATLLEDGLTDFKKAAEYVICLLIVTAGVLLWRRRDALPFGTWHNLRAALTASIIAELWFTVYQSAATWPNMLGHFFLVASAILIFRAIVDDGVARPHTVAVHKLRRAEAMHKRLEQGLLPSLPVDRDDLRVLSHSRPGERLLDLGGDFMDVLDLGRGGVAIICGDVSGHGPSAAALGVMVRASWQALNAAGVDAVTMARSLKAVIERERQSPTTYATLCLAWVDPRALTLRLLNLGHPVPLLILNGEVSPLAVEPTPPLGTIDWPVHDPPAIALSRGWQLFFYTDGLIEARMGPQSPERFGDARLLEIVRRRCSGTIGDACVQGLCEEIEAASGEPFADDVTVILISDAETTRAAATHD